jgi:RNA polymerase sigma factor (TIGR02999 family)
LRLIDQHSADWHNRAHFFGLAAEMMRRILVNHALARQAEKRGGIEPHISLDDALDVAVPQDFDLVALDEAMQRLAALDPQQSRIVELKFFAGLGIEEIAALLDLSPATIKREWRSAKAWLFQQIGDQNKKSAATISVTADTKGER